MENRSGTQLERFELLRKEIQDIPAGYDIDLEGIVMQIMDILIDKEKALDDLTRTIAVGPAGRRNIDAYEADAVERRCLIDLACRI